MNSIVVNKELNGSLLQDSLLNIRYIYNMKDAIKALLKVLTITNLSLTLLKLMLGIKRLMKKYLVEGLLLLVYLLMLFIPMMPLTWQMSSALLTVASVLYMIVSAHTLMMWIDYNKLPKNNS